MKKNNKKIRVLEICGGLSPEGIGTFLLNMEENINKDKFETNYVISTRYHQYYEEKVKNYGGNIYRSYEIGERIKGKIKHFFNLIKIIKKEGPFDVVHSHMDFFNGINLLAARIAKVPIRISHAHISNTRKEKNILKKLYCFLMRYMIRKFSTENLGCSREANLYINSVEGRIINNGINLEKFKNSNLPKDIKLDKDKINLITIGRIDAQKNPIFIVNVINELNKIRDDIHLYWIGSGSMENEVRSLIKKYDLSEKIALLGTRCDVNQILPNMDFMIFPSKYEGLGIVLIEAQASNIPCFISDKIPKESNLGMCTIIPLDKGEKYWADKINNYIINNSYENYLNNNKLSKFDIKTTVANLEKFYML